MHSIGYFYGMLDFINTRLETVAEKINIETDKQTLANLVKQRLSLLKERELLIKAIKLLEE